MYVITAKCKGSDAKGYFTGYGRRYKTKIPCYHTAIDEDTRMYRTLFLAYSRLGRIRELFPDDTLMFGIERI